MNQVRLRMKNVLIVDDDEDILTNFKALLQNNNTNIYTAPTVKSALTILEFTKIDVAILDYKLPKMPGDKLASYIKNKTPDTKVFIISGHYEAAEAVEKLDVKVHGFLKKPVDLDVLEKLVYNNDETVHDR